MTEPAISIVIPNWNGLVHLRDCLEAVGRQTLRPLETILVDNGSDDGSFDFVRDSFRGVHLIGLSRNYGFAYAVNRGIEAARGELIALLNNDTEVDARWLELLASALVENEKAGSAACKMLNFFDRDIIDAAGDVLTRSGSPFSRGHGMKDDGSFDTRSPVFGACAGAALYRRKLFADVGLFDEQFISYYEDADLAFRAQLAGFTCTYVPQAVCYHKKGATTGSQYPARMMERNLTAYYVKNFPWVVLMRKLPMILGGRVRRIFRSMLAGRGRSTWRGVLEGCLLIPSMLVKRHAVQRLRIVTSGYLCSFMEGNTE